MKRYEINSDYVLCLLNVRWVIGGVITSLSGPKITTKCSGICIFDNKYTAKTVIIIVKHQFQQVD